MALDIGEKRIGVAISDPQERVATPVTVLDANDVVQSAPRFKRLIEDHEPELIVCGLPVSLSGEEGPQAVRVRKVAQGIFERHGIEITFTDERLSSKEAKHVLRAEGLDERAMRGKVDMIAATIFLQAWLDDRARKGEGKTCQTC